MRSGPFAVLLAWMAACGPTGGLQFEIDATGDQTAQKVMFYIGKGEGQEASIAAAKRSPDPANEGRFWPSGLDPETFELAGSDRTVTLSFEPGGDSSKVTVVAVGLRKSPSGVYEATSVATKTVAHVRPDVIEVWTLKLEPVDGANGLPTGRDVRRWGEGPEDLTCVQAVDRSASDPALQNIFIGDRNDRDCDGHDKFLKDDELNPAECDDDWHGARIEPSLATISCMEEQPLTGSLGTACRFGGRACVDGSDTNSDCGYEQRFCAPPSLCRLCPETGTSSQDRFRCALDLDPMEHTQTLSFLHCPIPIIATATPPTVCGQPLHATPAPITQVACSNAPLYHSQTPASGWGSMAHLDNLPIQISFAPVSSGCVVRFDPKVMPGQPYDPLTRPEHGLLAVPLSNGSSAVVPVLFEYIPTDNCINVPRDCMWRSTFPMDDSYAKCLGLVP